MDSDDFKFFSVLAAVLATVCTLAIGIHWISCRHEENMARLGYEETTVPGMSSRVWRRAAEPLASAVPPLRLNQMIEEYVTTNASPHLDERLCCGAYLAHERGRTCGRGILTISGFRLEAGQPA